MSEAGRYLQQAVQTFENQGITNDIEIAQAISKLLLQRENWAAIVHGTSTASGLDLQLQSRLGRDGLHAVIARLEQALTASPFGSNLGTFYQREIRYELLKDQKPPQYPTPHHIADFMAALAVTDATTSVCDPAAGSGGLLVAAYRQRNGVQLAGRDFDPSWVDLGIANLRLHNLVETNNFLFQAESGLRLLENQENRFDCVLMAPPFNGSRSREEVAQAVGEDYGTASVNVMSALAVELLNTNGRTAFLVPTGILFGSGANANLRRLWLRHRLEAVVTLDRTCFQPYSNVAGHVILLQKLLAEAAEPSASVWFCTVDRDGYPEGAGRDLATDPGAESDELPRVQELLIRNRDDVWPHQITFPNDTVIEAIQLKAVNGVAGVAIRTQTTISGDNIAVWSLPNGYLVRPLGAGVELGAMLYLPTNNESAIFVDGAREQQVTWQEIVPAQGWRDSVSEKWKIDGEGNEVTVTVSPANASLQITTGTGKSRKSASFGAEQNATIAASLLDNDGVPLTPWLSATNLPDNLQALFEESFGGVTVSDLSGNTCAWLLSLTATDQNGQEGGENATLLVICAQQVGLAGTQTGEEVIGMLPNGFLRLHVTERSSLQIVTGNQLALPTGDFHGFAFGNTKNGTSVFASLVPRNRLQIADGTPNSFESKQFLPQPTQPPVRHPADVIAMIRKNQTKLAMRVDSLLQMVGHSHRVPEDTSTLFTPLFEPQQQQIWATIERQSDENRTRPFNLQQLAEWCATEEVSITSDELQRFLELACRMGIILPIHIGERNLYRAVQLSDYAEPTIIIS